MLHSKLDDADRIDKRKMFIFSKHIICPMLACTLFALVFSVFLLAHRSRPNVGRGLDPLERAG